jgi:hypothetical protein
MVGKTLTSIITGLVLVSAGFCLPGCGSKQDASAQQTAPPSPAVQQQLSVTQRQNAAAAAAYAKIGIYPNGQRIKTTN